MKRLIVIIGILVLIVALTYARSPKSDYQWTGSVVEVDNDHIVVQKGEEKWEFAHDKDTKMTGSPKAGSKVTVKYLMKATNIEVKEEAKKTEPKK
jgi:uncharacterized protein YxeA